MSAHTLKDLREQFKKQGKFHTPTALAEFMRDLIPDWEHARNVYDPTCGAGALLKVFPAETPKYGQDIDKAALDDAKQQLDNFHHALGDVLTHPEWVDQRFHAITANPPFSIPWTPNHEDERFRYAPCVPTKQRADLAFMLHIIHMLSDDGTAVVLQYPGALYRRGREARLRRYMVDELNVIDRVISVPPETFTDTSIPTVCLVLRKDRSPSAPIVFEDMEHDLKREVTIGELEEHDYTLTPGTYVQPPTPVREPVDPQALNQSAWDSALRLLASSLRLQQFICRLEGTDFEAYRREALDTINTI